LATQFGKLRLQFAIELMWRVVARKRRRGILGARDICQHFRGIGRMLGILDVAADLRPVHPAALRLARVIQHAGGQFQFGFGKLIRRGRGRKIRHRIIGRIQAFRGGILQTCDDAFAARGQSAALRP
jgi:hypothetical protein